MKKRTKKLVLNRETLAQLDNNGLRTIAGGETYTCITYPPRCRFSGDFTCETCDGGCTTNFC